MLTLWGPLRNEFDGLAQFLAHKKHSRFLQIIARLQVSYPVATQSVWPFVILFTGFGFCLVKKFCFEKQKHTDVRKAAPDSAESYAKIKRTGSTLNLVRYQPAGRPKPSAEKWDNYPQGKQLWKSPL